jgi:hypothetical protein
MSQAVLAERMGVSRQQVTKIVKGQENFTFETIEKLENALNVTLMTIGTAPDTAAFEPIRLSGTVTVPAGALASIFTGYQRPRLGEHTGFMYCGNDFYRLNCDVPDWSKLMGAKLHSSSLASWVRMEKTQMTAAGNLIHGTIIGAAWTVLPAIAEEKKASTEGGTNYIHTA